ncbi:vancomycin permeability regulator SanA [Lipingzhangella halophila]|uniref:Vancomycin permeability regulator SanA n=1 Tax=Lipingzhangella halophila TaxID=1783352 RepID=A0A7W7RDP8_9ACTN|nr:vancomycin permeability regulator SanA [Lipingzhangella halophila]
MRWSRRRVWFLATALGALLVLPVPFAWLTFTTSEHRSSVGDAPERPVAIVLGAGLAEDGSPATLLSRRLDIAAELYDRGTVQAVLVSGDNSREGYNEPDAMHDHLVAAGVPAAHVVGDYAGFSTWDSCARANRVFGVDSAIVVTQEFHLPRAVRLCQAAGVDTAGVGDASGEVRTIATVYGYVRELPAAFKAALDTVLTPEPTFLGPPEAGIDDALAAPAD